MAEQKIKIDLGSLSDLGKAIQENITKAMNDAAKDISGNRATQSQLNNAFSFKGLKENLAGSIKEGLSGTDKAAEKNKKLQAIYKANSKLSADFVGSIAKGASKTEILGKGLALAGNNIKGMLGNMNPYVAALQVAVKLTQEFLKQYQKTLEASRKFVSQGSLFTDKETMSMMQRTGQSASGAQGTSRALDRLGISFDDIQSGRVTQAQMKAFEEIRKVETERLEEIARVGGPVFEAMQKGALGMAGAKQAFDDMITFAFAKSKGVMVFAETLASVAEKIGGIFTASSSIIAPVINLISGVLATIMHAVDIIMSVIQTIFEAVAPIFDVVNEVINIIMTNLGALFKIVGKLVEAILAPFKIIGKMIANTMSILQAYISAFMSIITPIIDVVMMVVDILTSMTGGMNAMGGAMKALQPVMDIVITSIKIVGAAIGWVIGKIGEGIKWVWDKISGFIGTVVNAIPKALHSLIGTLVDLYNNSFLSDILGKAKAVGDYQGIDLGSMLSGLQGGLNNTLAAIQGDTFTYNYGTNSGTGATGTSNVNLFANMYTIVND
jgi:hypothetical protein